MKRLGFILFFLPLAACASHISPYQAKVRKYETGTYAPQAHASGASLYVEGTRGLFEDDRAGRVGDIVIVRVDETDEGTHNATSKLARNGSNDYGAAATLGILGALQKSMPGVTIDPAKLLSTSSSATFDGSGEVTRKGKLSGTLPVRVKGMTPNGDLYIEGTKVVLVNDEEHHLYLSGIIRQADIKPDGSIGSSLIADAEIEYTGRGDVSDQQRAGWMSRILSSLWPF